MPASAISVTFRAYNVKTGHRTNYDEVDDMARNILVVDDEPEKSLPLVHHLEQEGYVVHFVRGVDTGELVASGRWAHCRLSHFKTH